MPLHAATQFLLASPDPALLAAIEPFLLPPAHCVEIVLSAQARSTQSPAASPPDLALLDANLPGMPIGNCSPPCARTLRPRISPLS